MFRLNHSVQTRHSFTYTWITLDYSLVRQDFSLLLITIICVFDNQRTIKKKIWKERVTQYSSSLNMQFFCVCNTKKRQFWKNLYKQLRLRNEPQGLILVFALIVLLLPHLRWGNKLYCCAAHTEKDVRSRSPQDTSHVKRERENRGEVGEASLVARSLCTACRAADV